MQNYEFQMNLAILTLLLLLSMDAVTAAPVKGVVATRSVENEGTAGRQKRQIGNQQSDRWNGANKYSHNFVRVLVETRNGEDVVTMLHIWYNKHGKVTYRLHYIEA